MSDILIIRFSSLGDVVMVSSVIEALYRYRPEMHIHLLTKKAYASLFQNDDRLASLTGISGTESPRKIAHMLPVRQFGYVLDLHSVLRSRAVTVFVKADKVVTADKKVMQRRLMIWSRNRWRRTFDTLGGYLDTLSSMNINERVLPRLILGDDTGRNALKHLEVLRANSDIPVVGIAPGAKHATKRWLAEYFANVADRIQNAGLPAVFIGDENDRQFIDEIAKSMRTPLNSFAGSLNLIDTAGVIGSLSALITNDSGPMHIAGALGVPSVSIFGPTHPDLGFVPGYPQCRILHTGVGCSPCSLHGEKGCRMPERYCMNGITAPMVCDALNRIMHIPFKT